MTSSTDLKNIFAEARPIIERSLDDSELLAAIRDAAAAKGIDWSQAKALLKAQILDERDDSGSGKRVAKLIEKAEFASAYAAMLGLDAKMNEKNNIRSSSSEVPRANTEPADARGASPSALDDIPAFLDRRSQAGAQ
jgi:hypothetical protein